MRLSTSTNIMNFDQQVNYAVKMEDSTRVCSKAGYRFLDANLCGQTRPGQPLAAENWLDWAHRMRAVADEAKVSFTQAHAYWPINYTVYPDGSRSDGELGEELMRRSVIAAEILGSEWMVVHPLTVSDEAWYSAKKSQEYNLEYFSRWGEFYAKHNVGMAIENMNYVNAKMKYCANPDELIELVETIGDARVGICLDTGHAHLSGVDVPAVIRKFGGHLRATHIADNHQNKDEHFAPFNGTIDWTGVMKALKAINYAHDFSFEIHNLSSYYPASVQSSLVKFSYDLGNYLLSLG